MSIPGIFTDALKRKKTIYTGATIEANSPFTIINVKICKDKAKAVIDCDISFTLTISFMTDSNIIFGLKLSWKANQAIYKVSLKVIPSQMKLGFTVGIQNFWDILF